MGMSIYAQAVTPPDDRWHAMKAVWESCTQADIDVPPEVSKFFNHEPPDHAGVVHTIRPREYNDSEACATYYEIALDRLPPDATHVRFVASY